MLTTADPISAQSVAALLGQEDGRFCARGATALYLAARAMLPAGSSVIVPAIACPAIIYPLLAARLRPILCDVELDTYNASPGTIEKALEGQPEVAAILAVHAFGHALDMSAIRRLADTRGLLLIEDVCQALGGTHAGRPLGAFGHVALGSFGATKQIDLGRGGIVASGDPRILDQVDQLQRELEWVDELPEWQRLYREAYLFIEHLGSQQPGLLSLGQGLASAFARLFVHEADLNWTEGLRTLTADLDEDVIRRRRLTEVYAGVTTAGNLHHPRLPDGSNPWRYTFRGSRAVVQHLGALLRARNFQASHWYPSLVRRCVPETAPLPNAARLDGGFLNLWLDRTVSLATAAAQRELIESHLQTHA